MGVPRQFFARCPSCFRNFAQLWCQSTCSPKQSKFLKVTNEAIDETSKKSYVTSIEYNIADEFVEGLYNSCKNVQFPGSNQRALGMICGIESDKCTIDRWLRFMGDQSINPLVPFNIDFKRFRGKVEKIKDGVRPQNATIVPCDRAPDSRTLACSCQDCQQACTVVAAYPEQEKSKFTSIKKCMLPYISAVIL